MVHCGVSLFPVVYGPCPYQQGFVFHLLQNFTWAHLCDIPGLFELLLACFGVWSQRRYSTIEFFLKLNKNTNTSAL